MESVVDNGRKSESISIYLNVQKKSYGLANYSTMSALSEFLRELNKETDDLEQISSYNKRLSEEKILTRHLIEQVRILTQLIQLQQEGNQNETEQLIMNYS